MKQQEFRAWDFLEKKMRNDYLGKSGDKEDDWILFFGREKINDKQVEGINNPFPRQRFKLMQYINIKDKNKQKIYELDILSDGNGKPGIVIYVPEHGSFLIAGYNDDGGSAFYQFNNDADSDGGFLTNTEVIGNYFENNTEYDGNFGGDIINI